jgi:tRNA pseudouridine32 synthase / 23S rRNA pseudouridine746 synthase
LIQSISSAFNSFAESLAGYVIPENFTLSYGGQPHPVSALASKQLQLHLQNQKEWEHNFGLTEAEGAVIGKMFGVLVVETKDGEVGYLAAFSGKLAGSNHHPGFVPPIFDGLKEGGFVNIGMTELSRISDSICNLEKLGTADDLHKLEELKTRRKEHSILLQNTIFDQYYFLNQAGERKGLREIFDSGSYKNPPAGAGECAAPKLLQYAFQHRLKPLAIAEFWWGLSPKSATWKHGHFYPACREKCLPILTHMLSKTRLEAAL